MGYLSKLRKPERVELSGDYWADVRAPSGDDNDDARDAAMGGKEGMAAAARARAKDPEAETPFDRKVFNHELLSRCIVAWNLDDDSGAVLSVTSETVAYLADVDRDRVLLAAQTRTKLPEKKGLPGNSD